jgi:hypothetical protein
MLSSPRVGVMMMGDGFKISDTTVGALTFAVVGILTYWFSYPEDARQRFYAFRFGTPQSRVTIQPRPTDCNFFEAPYGLKKCGYITVVESSLIGQDRYVEVRWVRDNRPFMKTLAVPCCGPSLK